MDNPRGRQLRRQSPADGSRVTASLCGRQLRRRQSPRTAPAAFYPAASAANILR